VATYCTECLARGTGSTPSTQTVWDPVPHPQPPQEEGEAAEPFYSDPACRRMFQTAAAAMVGRVNTVNGVQYRCGTDGCVRGRSSAACAEQSAVLVAPPAHVFLRSHAAPSCCPRDDPTILAWSLANEPRCVGDRCAAAIPRWARWAAGLLKGLDPNHMVTLVGRRMGRRV
jgi:mannan endo-1,4-beta-mannosidase